jgi:hypothetical protein
MAFVYDSTCLVNLPDEYFPENDYYATIVLQGYVYSDIQVYNEVLMPLEVTVRTNTYNLTTSLRLKKEDLIPSKKIIITTSERVAPRIYISPFVYSLPKWVGPFSGGTNKWLWQFK